MCPVQRSSLPRLLYYYALARCKNHSQPVQHIWIAREGIHSPHSINESLHTPLVFLDLEEGRDDHDSLTLLIPLPIFTRMP